MKSFSIYFRKLYSLSNIFISYIFINVSYLLLFHEHENYYLLNHFLRNNDLINNYVKIRNNEITIQKYIAKENNRSSNIFTLKYLFFIFFRKLDFYFFLSNNVTLSKFDFIKYKEISQEKTIFSVINHNLISSTDIEEPNNIEEIFSSNVILVENIINNSSLISQLIEYLSLYNYIPYNYSPKNRIFRQIKHFKYNEKSLIFIKDYNFVKKRTIQSQKFKFGYLVF